MNITYLIFLITILIIIIVFIFKKQEIKKANSKISNDRFTTKDLTSLKIITEDNSKYKILVVEDDPVNRKILKAQLTAAKYKVISASTGKSALKLINEDKEIDIILLDLILPDISGIKVCKQLRNNYTMYERPVIMVTSKNHIKDLIEGFEAGANDFITKPYNLYELIARINSYISLKNIFEDNTSLKKINKLKSDIVDMAAHDLKSPLTLISGYSNRIIKNTTTDSKESKNALKILNSSNKMLSIINKLLNESRYENQILNFEDIEIGSFITNSIKYYEDMANIKNQKINFILPEDKVLTKIDKESLNAIIDNLISNAIKYSPIKGIIEITLTENNQSIIISINDSGNGFTQDEIDNLFIKFFPFTNKPTKGENSTGLGLYIINDMVTRNNGTIHVNSIRGQGSEFILTFPKN